MAYFSNKNYYFMTAVYLFDRVSSEFLCIAQLQEPLQTQLFYHSLLLPLLKLEYFTIETDSRILLLLKKFQQNTVENSTQSFDFWRVGICLI
jgi:hypothetical protein